MKLWGGRFGKATAAEVETFGASLPFDRRLYREDVLGSAAHCRMLARQGIIAPEEAKALLGGLREVLGEAAAGTLPLDVSLEDIHMAVESRLREKLGDVAGRLHTARSRNDQVALDFRLFVRGLLAETVAALAELQVALLDLAAAHPDVVLPGYTHLQRAQPVLLAHHLLAYVEMLGRDVERCQDAYRRVDRMPLGSGALAGLPYPLDRESVARELGFSAVTRNSMDAVSDRDFVAEYLAMASVAMMHLSRLAEEVVVWTTAEFGYLELDDAFATGSSIMPQKKNPDVAELVRGKTGRVYGHLVGILTVLKGLPLTYNKDLQEDKEGLFDAGDTLLGSLRLFAPMLRTARFRAARMRQAAGESFSLATDLADFLVRKGLPFRDAHGVIGRLVAYCLDQGKDFTTLSLDEYRRFSPLFDGSVRDVTVDSAVAARDVVGGTAPARVAQELTSARAAVAEGAAWAAATAARLPGEELLEPGTV